MRVHVCMHSSGTEDLRGKRLTYDAVKALVLEAGRFSVFEATSSMRHARIFDELARDPELLLTTVGFPWTRVERKVPTP